MGLEHFFLHHSLQAFVKDASSFSHEAVDRLLDVLTEGAHSKYLKQMAEVIVMIREPLINNRDTNVFIVFVNQSVNHLFYEQTTFFYFHTEPSSCSLTLSLETNTFDCYRSRLRKSRKKSKLKKTRISSKKRKSRFLRRVR